MLGEQDEDLPRVLLDYTIKEQLSSSEAHPSQTLN